MARIAGVNIPQNKVVHVALTYIHGIGNNLSNKICSKLKNLCFRNILKSVYTSFQHDRRPLSPPMKKYEIAGPV